MFVFLIALNNIIKEDNGEMFSAYSSYLSSDKQVQEELILTLSHKHHSYDIETPEDLPSAAEIAEILIQLSKEDESTSNCAFLVSSMELVLRFIATTFFFIILQHSWAQIALTSGDMADFFKYLIEMHPALWMK
jgi:hypothetical protein